MYDYILGGGAMIILAVWLLIGDIIPRARRNAARRNAAARQEAMNHHPAGKGRA